MTIDELIARLTAAKSGEHKYVDGNTQVAIQMRDDATKRILRKSADGMHVALGSDITLVITPRER